MSDWTVTVDVVRHPAGLVWVEVIVRGEGAIRLAFSPGAARSLAEAVSEAATKAAEKQREVWQ